MATITVTAGGTYTPNPGDVYIIDPTLAADVTIEAPHQDFTVRIDQSSTSGVTYDVRTNADDVIIADNVNSPNVHLFVSSEHDDDGTKLGADTTADEQRISIGDNVTINRLLASANNGIVNQNTYATTASDLNQYYLDIGDDFTTTNGTNGILVRYEGAINLTTGANTDLGTNFPSELDVHADEFHVTVGDNFEANAIIMQPREAAPTDATNTFTALGDISVRGDVRVDTPRGGEVGTFVGIIQGQSVSGSNRGVFEFQDLEPGTGGYASTMSFDLAPIVATNAASRDLVIFNGNGGGDNGALETLHLGGLTATDQQLIADAWIAQGATYDATTGFYTFGSVGNEVDKDFFVGLQDLQVQDGTGNMQC